MKKSDFYYDLPQRLIAQTPPQQRDSSRLMVLSRQSGTVTHRHFYDLKKYMRAGDCLVLNDTKVLPARLYGRKEGTGAAVEVLLLADRGGKCWECTVYPGKKLRQGAEISYGDGSLTAIVRDVLDSGNRIVEFACEGIFLEKLEQLGTMPLPHYITEKLEDSARYQTVYARESGSAAAPTAGLHFTPQLLDELQAMGVSVAKLTLHVGLGTFRPVKADDITDHKMHSESYRIDAQAARTINEAKLRGGRIIAVGTTSCRTLESACDSNGFASESSGSTDIFIYPGYAFKAIDGIITNFHLPESTLIMLVSAFAGKDSVMNAYKQAIAEEYRFFSFGDAMLIL